MNKSNPWLVLIISALSFLATIILFSMSTYFAQKYGWEGDGTVIVRFILGLSGLASVLGIIVGIPVGIVLMVKKQNAKAETSSHPASKTAPGVPAAPGSVDPFIKKWSWGAFFGGFIWVLGNRMYKWAIGMLILALIPVLGGLVLFGLSIYLGIKGREIAWAKGWASLEEFKKRQKVMAWVILVVIILLFAMAFAAGDL